MATHVYGWSQVSGSTVVEMIPIASIGGSIADNAATNAKLADMAQATLKGRASGAGTGDPDDLTAAQVRTILNVADGATANSPDATLLNRANHTGTQAAATISDLTEVVQDFMATTLVAGTNVTITYNDTSNTITIAAASGAPGADTVTNTLLADMAQSTIKGRSTAGTGDPEDLTAAQVRTILNVADGATANSSDATLLARANHTGTQTASTISDFAEALDDRVAALLVAGTGITLTYNDGAGTITVDASGAASGNFNPGGTGATVRTQDVKMREVGISVLDYGADPTGVAASDTAFANAAAAAVTYGMRRVWIPAGTYRLNNQWVLSAPLFWQGAGRNQTIIKSYYTADHGMEIIGDGGTDFIRLESFQFQGAATHAADLHGIRVAWKSRWYSVYVNGFTNDGIWMDTLSGGASGAVFFMHMNDVWSKNNGRDGIRVRAGANACIFTNCDWSNNGDYGFHHLTDGFPTYGNVLIGGQASYNGLYGYYFESGTDLQAYGLYAEQNCCSTPGNNSTDYSTTRLDATSRLYDFYIGDNVSRSHINIGTLFSSSLTHVRAPSRGLNDGCAVYQGGRRIHTSAGVTTSYTVPTEGSAVATISTANATDLASAIALANQLKTTVNDLLSKLRSSNAIAP